MNPALNPFSRRLADLLLAAHPEWASLVRADPEGFPAPGSLRVEVPSPLPGRALLIRTYGDQVTVDFGADGWHEHFMPAADGDAGTACAAALRLIDDLLADRVVVATRHLAGRRLWSRAVRHPVRRPRLGSITVVSWSGARDT